MSLRKLTKKLHTVKALGLAAALTTMVGGTCLAQSVMPELSPGQYATVMTVHDWGASISKLVVDLGQEIDVGSVDKDTFKVSVKRSFPLGELAEGAPMLGESEGQREVLRAYVSDKDGNVVVQGRYVAIEMSVGPDVSLGSPMNFNTKSHLNRWIASDYLVEQQEDIQTVKGVLSGFTANDFAGRYDADTKDFHYGTEIQAGINFAYASYEPQDGGKHPLIIWLHGLGEGGHDAMLPITANKASAFAGQTWQKGMGGAYVFAPQCPTYWMDNGKGNLNGGNIIADGTSIYSQGLMELIKSYVSKHPQIDTDRIYLGGDSNGGFMAMLLLRDNTDYFAAYFPTCEALPDKLLTDADIAKMKDANVWFVAAADDPTVPVKDHVVPTVQRLREAGGKNIQLSMFDNVVDPLGNKYLGHFSWIYVYNNACTSEIAGENVTLCEWLAAQHK